MSASTRIAVRIRRLPHSDGIDLPTYQSAGAAGLDLACALASSETKSLAPGGRALVPTGFCIELPEGFEAQIRPRSGLALKHGVTVLNTPGTIDCDYRGEIKVLLVNLGDAPFLLERGVRMAQLVIAPVARAEIEVAAELSDTSRKDGGFGSTGTN